MKFKTMKLSELTVDGRGHYGIGASAVEKSDELYAYLRITDIYDDGTLNKAGLKSVDDPDAEKYLLKPNDIVFARTGNSVGKSYFYDERDGAFVYAGFLIKFSLDPAKVNPRFVKYYCQSQRYKNWVASFSTGSTRGNINAQTYGDMGILTPCRTQQDFLVEILSALDDKIELNRRINANLEQQAAAIYSQMFVETPNNDRKIVPAGEFFDISIGKTPPRKELRWFSENPEDCVWVSISDMGNCGLYIGESSEYLTREAVDKHNVKIVPDNTVILSFKLTVGRVAITDGELTTNEAIAHFKTDFPKINEYLYFYLKYFNYNELGSTSSIATAVNSKIVKTLPFVVPTDDEIERFHQIAAVFFEQIKTNQYEIVRLTAVRDALLPRLMSGEIDVSDVSL